MSGSKARVASPPQQVGRQYMRVPHDTNRCTCRAGRRSFSTSRASSRRKGQLEAPEATSYSKRHSGGWVATNCQKAGQRGKS